MTSDSHGQHFPTCQHYKREEPVNTHDRQDGGAAERLARWRGGFGADLQMLGPTGSFYTTDIDAVLAELSRLREERDAARLENSGLFVEATNAAGDLRDAQAKLDAVRRLCDETQERGSWFVHIHRLHAVLPGSGEPAADHRPEDGPDQELPGTWSTADFGGGWADSGGTP